MTEPVAVPTMKEVALSPIGDSVRMPWADAGNERVVRPALAVLYRMAVGPAADYYVPRFLRFEWSGRTFPSWHWASFWLPGVWAFYRKLWLPGIALAALPILGAASFAMLEPSIGDSDVAWFALAAISIWILPCIVSALFANGLLYRRVRRMVRRAEARRRGIGDVATFLTTRRPTAFAIAAAIGLAAVALAPQFVAPNLQALYHEHLVRGRIAGSLAAVRPLQRRVEASLLRFGAMPRTPDVAAMLWQRGAMAEDDVNLNPRSGRVRVALGSTAADLEGASILLAPAIDSRQHVRWVCVPVGVPRTFLPPECRNG
jgi:Protein of unknown function (DUF2628)